MNRGKRTLAWAWVGLMGVACSRPLPSRDLAGTDADPAGAQHRARASNAPQPAPKSSALLPQSAPSALPAVLAADSAPAPNLEPPARPAFLKLAGGARSVHSRYGVVTSVEAQATRAGIELLENGGNAIDAAVAVGFALAVTHPSAGNLGGGGFMLVHPRGEASQVVDFREQAPSGLTASAFERLRRSDGFGPLSAGIPGSVAGLLLAHERFGKLERSRVLAPAIELAERGYRIGPEQAASLRRNWPSLQSDRGLRRLFAAANGKPLPAGSLLRRPDLAATLRRIDSDGAAGFYSGTTADALLAALGPPRGLWARSDLLHYQAVLREPLRGSYRGLTVEVAPPPSAGGITALLTLGMLEASGAPELAPDDPLNSHLFVEASRRAQAERRFAVADPAALTPEDLARLQQFDGAALLARTPIDRRRATPSANVHPLFAQALRELEHTTHFSVVDAEQNIVSCTTTLSAGFGAKLMVAGTGVILNNSVGAFGSAGKNLPAPGRRPTSSMSPTLVLAGNEPLLVLGTPGGDTIPSTIVQVLRNIVDFGMPLDAAIDAPRLHHGFVPDRVRYEIMRPPPGSHLRKLRELGHQVVAERSALGDANNILIDNLEAYAYADPREQGVAQAVQPNISIKNAEAPSSATPENKALEP